ncbi:MAG: valine--tRNA ligase [Actinobacteria bacterium]|nr:MAG: valine--tRNA ligase [Actinomycetota bacterium]
MAEITEDLRSRTRFEPAEVEPRIVRRWLESGLFHPEPRGSAEENFSIAIPPPNVTGALHMGHALNGAIQDALVRYQRMRGRRTKWILGTDHAGIATQTQVERALAEEGSSREQLGREEFVRRVWRWRERYGGQIIAQYQRLGASCDYEDERFTLDDRYVRAVIEVFVRLYEQGLIYRDNYMVNWDPGSRSAISDLEVEDREVTDTLFSVAYPLADGPGELVVVTVRPETMLADTAVAVHPADERYAHLIGKAAILPLVGRELPIIGDDYVKPDFGSGALKVTPGHDPNDFEIGRRHGLTEITVIGEDGRLRPEAGERFAGLTVEEAQRAVVQALHEQGAIRAAEPYLHEVPYSHRSGERIEPLISLQWFLRMDELAELAAAPLRDGRIEIHPDSQARRYLQWLAEIRPWCISRQLWWGHQLPVWYRGAETYVGASSPEGEGWERDPDVLDTWFSSALWPFATLGWPEQTPELSAFYPTDVMVTARDILFLWVARMAMMGLRFTDDVPFADVYVHSVIQAPDGRRMSKSLGTGIDPSEEIERHGADAVRFGLLAMSSTQDVRYSAEKIQQGQQLANKLFNASRYVLLSADLDVGAEPDPATIEDRWILSRLQRVKSATAQRLESFDFSHAALGLYDFVYGELCDWYLELVKPRLAEAADAATRRAASATLLYVLRETLAVAHPVIPFVTEEVWSYLPAADAGPVELLAGARWPAVDQSRHDPAAEAALGAVIDAVQALRGWRDRVGARPGQWIKGRLEATGYEHTGPLVERMARVDLHPGTAADEERERPAGEPLATVPVPGGAVAVLAADGVDLEAAERRTGERRAKLESEVARSEAKLANDGFVSKAPAAVVDAERSKLTALRAELEAL